MARPKGPPGQARQRVVDAALELFAEHGVGGTSLQMIADRLGVTKAAVYHQFPAKDDIALAIVEPLFAAMTALVEGAEAASEEDRLGVVLRGLVAAILDQRQRFGTWSHDPEFGRLAREHPENQVVVARLENLLRGSDPTPRRLIAVTLFTSGVIGCAIAPNLVDIDDELMREELDRLATILVGS
ncbi:MAG: TetR/AcrR family transcriptional regulator [Marmoricola sp.]|nr:TetR/AcrR family transcriptional regulator [Marmoricola sp.]